MSAREFVLEVFDADGVNPRVRWHAPGEPMAERGIDRDVVAGLLSRSRKDFVVAGASVAELGADLYRWLDGPTHRWLETARSALQPIMLRLPTGEGLGALPWELLHDGGFLALDQFQPVIPIRACTTRRASAPEPANRPLRLLFMACSPLDVEPVLDYEAEEAVILNAAKGRVEVVVEESGSLAGLKSILERFPVGHFDAVHISGHATVLLDHEAGGGARFVMEDDTGAPLMADARDIARAMGGSWPRLVFVSGCSTAASSEAEAVTSMAQALVQAGGPAVLGWALPVGDQAASSLAATLYGELARGVDIATAVTSARIALEENHSPFWYLLRLYADASPLTPVVTRLGTAGRPDVSQTASALFLDPAGQVKVADRTSFVGRRRELQRLLRELRPEDPAEGPRGALIHGMGGLGKSSLTARLLDRMSATHPHQAVWVGKVDPASMTKMGGALKLSATPEVDQQVNKFLNAPDLELSDRLRYVLAGPLSDRACVFVFDDFESGNLTPDGHGGQQCTPEALEVLTALVHAIKQTNSRSRVLITSRHDFALPAHVDLFRLGVMALHGNDLDKKLRLTRHLGPASHSDPAIRDRAIAVAAGVPRLIERLDSLLDTHAEENAVTSGDDTSTVEHQLDALEAAGVEYRDDLALGQLLDAQSPRVCRALVLAAVYETAVPREAITALSHEDRIQDDVDAAVAVGLLQTGLHPTTGEQRYLVSPLVRPLLDELPERLTADDLREAQQRGAHYLYQCWVNTGDQ